VCCHAVIRLINVDPKGGEFKVRVKCHWAFRMQNTQDNSEVLMRGVPGIRIPAVTTTVEESRVWKDFTATEKERHTNHNTVYWKGTSTFLLEGYKIFHMQNFPFDRHIINLENIDFVWRPEADSADYFKSMKVVVLTTDLVTVLPEWDTFDAFVKPIKPADCANFAQTFNWQLRIERADWFYIRQVFWLSYLMTCVSATPLAIPNQEEHIGSRLGIFGAGMLTLVSFKYSVADHLPCVPYATFADDFLNLQILTIALCCFETIGFYVFFHLGDEAYGMDEVINSIENKSFVAIIIFWTLYMLFVCFVKRRKKNSWEFVYSKDKLEGYFEVNDPFDYFDEIAAKERKKDAEKEKNEYGKKYRDCRWWRGFFGSIGGFAFKNPLDVELQFGKAQQEYEELTKLRDRLDLNGIRQRNPSQSTWVTQQANGSCPSTQ